MRARIGRQGHALVWCVAALGCAEPRPEVSPLEVARPASTCAVTLCLTGALDQTSGSNGGFERLCRRDELEGVVEDCDTETCYRTHDSFLKDPASAVYPKLFAALDANADGAVDASDPFCDVNLLGFSWGGVNAIEVARALNADARVAPAQRRVARLLLMDPYQPMAGGKMRVPVNVARTVVWRHSVADPGDCSRVAPLGPYTGMAAVCETSQVCLDVDYSRAPAADSLPLSWRRHRGRNVGHCAVPRVATPDVLEELTGGDPFAPPGG
jgi:pimeloyl-ACP methyl ester carboxylesterase